MLTQEYLKQRLDYNPETGIMTWKCRIKNFNDGQWNSRFAGKEAGINLDHKNGYNRVRLDNKNYLKHRVIWLWMTGKFPKQVDHRNGIKTDNRWENLREAKNHKENGENRKTSKSNKSGYTGVSWHKGGQKWAAQIKSEGKIYHLGSYDDPKEAYEAYLVAKQKYHKFQPIPREQTNGAQEPA